MHICAEKLFENLKNQTWHELRHYNVFLNVFIRMSFIFKNNISTNKIRNTTQLSHYKLKFVNNKVYYMRHEHIKMVD